MRASHGVTLESFASQVDAPSSGPCGAIMSTDSETIRELVHVLLVGMKMEHLCKRQSLIITHPKLEIQTDIRNIGGELPSYDA